MIDGWKLYDMVDFIIVLRNIDHRRHRPVATGFGRHHVWLAIGYFLSDNFFFRVAPILGRDPEYISI